MVETKGPFCEGLKGARDVRSTRVDAFGEEALDRSPRLDHLSREEQQTGDVAAVAPAMAEAGEHRGERIAGRGRATASAGLGPSAPEHDADALLDLADGAEGQGRGEEPDDLAVARLGLLPHELERVGRDEPVVVVSVELVETPPQLVDAHDGI